MAAPQTVPPTYAPAPDAQDVAPPMQQRVYSYPTGQWVYTDGDGWVWVPSGAATTVVEGAPYAYLYTPAYGWTWYVSPWGLGPYHYGAWVSHPWRPVGWRGGWVAHPRIVAHLGHPRFVGHVGVRVAAPRAVVHGGGFHGGGGFRGGGHAGHR